MTTAAVEGAVAVLVGKTFGVTFGDARRNCAPWGQFDRCLELQPGRWLVLEVEGAENHPTTSVLKAWPVLEESPQLSMFMVHVFLADARARNSSRGRLAQWLGQKMETLLAPRFRYRHQYIDTLANAFEDVDELQREFDLWRSNAA